MRHIDPDGSTCIRMKSAANALLAATGMPTRMLFQKLRLETKPIELNGSVNRRTRNRFRFLSKDHSDFALRFPPERESEGYVEFALSLQMLQSFSATTFRSVASTVICSAERPMLRGNMCSSLPEQSSGRKMQGGDEFNADTMPRCAASRGDDWRAGSPGEQRSGAALVPDPPMPRPRRVR